MTGRGSTSSPGEVAETEIRAENLYDVVPYPGHAYKETHPDHLAAIGILFGMAPPAVDQCRVLDIGCGDGLNLVSIAVQLPHSDCVGIDLAVSAIDSAQELAARAKTTNVKFYAMDVMDVDVTFGQFDYIIAHGFYSWVPPIVQQKLLQICQLNLSERGIAFVSYNTNPGGRLRQIAREAMLFGSNAGSPLSRVQKGKEFLGALADGVSDNTWKALLKNECERVSKRDERVTYHDEFADNYLPVYFRDFMEAAAKNGLQFLGEARLADARRPAGKESLAGLAKSFVDDSVIAEQQFSDFVTCRGFRRTLLCHDTICLQRDDLASKVTKLWAASPLVKRGMRPDGGREFANSRGEGTLATNNPSLVRVLERLGELWPQGAPFEELVATAGSDASGKSAELPQALLDLACSTLVDFRTHRLPIGSADSRTPAVTPLARVQASKGSAVTTLMHTGVEIGDAQTRSFIQLLDGSHNRNDLTDWLVKQVPGNQRTACAEQVHKTLLALHRIGLLVEQ